MKIFSMSRRAEIFPISRYVHSDITATDSSREENVTFAYRVIPNHATLCYVSFFFFFFKSHKDLDLVSVNSLHYIVVHLLSWPTDTLSILLQ